MQCFRDKSKVSAAERQVKLDDLEKSAVNNNSSSGATVVAAPNCASKTASVRRID